MGNDSDKTGLLPDKKNKTPPTRVIGGTPHGDAIHRMRLYRLKQTVEGMQSIEVITAGGKAEYISREEVLDLLDSAIGVTH